MSRSPAAVLSLVTVIVAIVFGSTSAHARGGIAPLTHGETIVELGPIVEGQRQYVREATGTLPSVGYVYGSFGLFGLELWTWDGRFCLTDGGTLWELDAAHAAGLLGSIEARPPWRYSTPPGLVALVDATAFGALPNVEKLYLDNNQLGDVGACELAQALAPGPPAQLRLVLLVVDVASFCREKPPSVWRTLDNHFRSEHLREVVDLLERPNSTCTAPCEQHMRGSV